MAYVFPNKIFPSALNSYLQCPFKFKCHNDKEVKAEFIENPESFIGKIIHIVLQELFDIKKISIEERKNQDLGQLVRYFWARMSKNSFSKEYWTKEERRDLFGSVEQEKAFGLQAIAILNNYVSKADLSVSPLFLEDWMDCKVGDFLVAGRIDRIDQDSESSISVWDYKTGKLPFHGTIEKMIEQDLQVPIYAVIASERNPFAKQIRAGLIYVKYSRVFDIVWTREQLMELKNKIIATIEKAKNDNSFLPTINKLCPWCEYKPVCPERDKIEERYKKVEEVSW